METIDLREGSYTFNIKECRKENIFGIDAKAALCEVVHGGRVFHYIDNEEYIDVETGEIVRIIL